MLALYRAAVAAVAQSASSVVWTTLPDDPAELPCVVIGLPQLEPESETVFDARVDVYVVGSRTGAGVEDELIEKADELFDAFGGSKGVSTGHDTDAGEVGVIAVDTVRSTRLEIGGQQYPAYTLTVAASLTTC